MAVNSLLKQLRQAPASDPALQPFPRKELAVAVLLIEAAQIDRRVSPGERAVMERLVRERFALPANETACLLTLARGEFALALDDWVFTQTVRESFAQDAREEILEMIWEVIYADRQLARFEDRFMQRMAESLGVNEAAADRARGAAFARISTPERWSNEP